MRKILILGFYDRHNLGDDCFKAVFQKLFQLAQFSDCDVTIICSDDCQTINADVDVLIIGGGCVLNNYFIGKIIKLCSQSHYKGKIITYSSGLDSHEMILTGQLDIIDHFIIRNPTDAKILTDRYGVEYVTYVPDLIFNIKDYIDIPRQIQKTKSKNMTLTLCLARPVCVDNVNYQDYINDICSLIIKLPISHINLLPFNINRRNPKECDILMNTEIHDQLLKSPHPYRKINNIVPSSMDFYDHCQLAMTTIRDSDFVICSRFHAHVMSMIYKVPFISITHTRKVQELISTYELSEFSVKPFYNSDGKEKGFDVTQAYYKFMNLIKNRSKIVSRLENIEHPNNHEKLLKTLIYEKDKRLSPPFFVKDGSHIEIVSNIKSQLCSLFGVTNFTQSCGHSDLHRRIVQYILLMLTGDPFPEYYYGLNSKIFTPNFNIDEDLKWVYTNNASISNGPKQFNPSIVISPTSNHLPVSILNMTYMRQNLLKGYHRSGWNYAVNDLGIVHKEKSSILLDTYIDKTFHWAKQVYKDSKILPYKQPWIGFCHHTPDTDYSDYNVTAMINDPMFRQSMKWCIGLFTLSKTMKQWFEKELPKCQIYIPIESLVHPTEIPHEKFTMNSYIENKNKKIIQIGAWLRNVYSIYAVNIVAKHGLNKCHLKGKEMDTYFLPQDFDFSKDLKYALSLQSNPVLVLAPVLAPVLAQSQSHRNPKMCRDFSKNKYISFMIQYLSKNFPINIENLNMLTEIAEDNHNSVQMIERVSNQQYDQLLCNNIVFIDLIEASACNTLIECIVRNTPIIINKIPAVVELLGDQYPLYFTNLKDVNNLLDLENIRAGHKYLKKLDKTPYEIKSFVDTFIKSKIFKRAQKISQSYK